MYTEEWRYIYGRVCNISNYTYIRIFYHAAASMIDSTCYYIPSCIRFVPLFLLGLEVLLFTAAPADAVPASMGMECSGVEWSGVGGVECVCAGREVCLAAHSTCVQRHMCCVSSLLPFVLVYCSYTTTTAAVVVPLYAMHGVFRG